MSRQRNNVLNLHEFLLTISIVVIFQKPTLQYILYFRKELVFKNFFKRSVGNFTYINHVTF